MVSFFVIALTIILCILGIKILSKVNRKKAFFTCILTIIFSLFLVFSSYRYKAFTISYDDAELIQQPADNIAYTEAVYTYFGWVYEKMISEIPNETLKNFDGIKMSKILDKIYKDAHLITILSTVDITIILMIFLSTITKVKTRINKNNSIKKVFKEKITLKEFEHFKEKYALLNQPEIFHLSDDGFLTRKEIKINPIKDLSFYPATIINHQNESHKFWRADLPLNTIACTCCFTIQYGHQSIGYNYVTSPFNPDNKIKVFKTPSINDYNQNEDIHAVYIPEDHICSIFGGESDGQEYAKPRDIKLVIQVVDHPDSLKKAGYTGKVADYNNKKLFRKIKTEFIEAEYADVKLINIFPKDITKTKFTFEVSAKINQKHLNFLEF